jgi:transcriptional regulator of aromatic amino acid metabolism
MKAASTSPRPSSNYCWLDRRVGHVAGAFTDAKADRAGRFKVADGGTLFLDEIATIPINLQPRLLRALESGRFRRDLLYRLNTVEIRVPRIWRATCKGGWRPLPNGRNRSTGSLTLKYHTKSRLPCSTEVAHRWKGSDHR